MKQSYKNKLIIFFLIGIVTFLYSSCDTTDRNHFKLYSIDKKQCVTIITKMDTRYIINGNHDSVPISDYVKIDISEIDPIGDEIGVCWNNGNYDWEIVNHQSKVIVNKLDTLKYKFNINWELDERRIPNCLKYHQSNCGTIGLSHMKIYKNKGIILEY